ncbi:mono-/di-acylglycerol lipase,Lipase, class 3 [Artemisia annua]|uniref:Mono-/di-acylglycerol lipase,Lipase, class 3 n=1 Tax=Artemisia annua TaxID=35608 RepID=A0A2U1MNA1_ARTAN|nr:mono-/di-acylglycerol lipase,Lipase, class 3 [Artemisia annua]
MDNVLDVYQIPGKCCVEGVEVEDIEAYATSHLQRCNEVLVRFRKIWWDIEGFEGGGDINGDVFGTFREVFRTVYRSASALGSRLPSIASANAKVAGAGEIIRPVSSGTQAMWMQ